MQKIDIVVTFNEINYKDFDIGYVHKKINNKSMTFVDQIIALKKSLNKNWKSFDGDFYAFHSERLSLKNKKKLEKKGIIVKHKQIIDKYKRYHNRLTPYDHFSNSDYTLILDSDILILQEPEFQTTKDIYLSPALNLILKPEEWEKYFNYIGNSFIEPINENAYKQKHIENKDSFFPHMNMGVILIANDCKKQIKNQIIELEDYLYDNGNYFNSWKIKHFFNEISLSTIFYNTKSRSMFDRGINFFSGVLPYDKNYVKIYHYLGDMLNHQEINDNFLEYFQPNIKII